MEDFFWHLLSGCSTLGPTMAYRASADGGVGILGGEVAFMRTVENSFAMVRVGEYEDVSVLLNNQPVAQTNEGGVAWVPGLLDYQDNVLTIDVLDLPLEAKVTTDKVVIAPYFRSAAVATFDVKPSRGALLRLILDDGEPMPVGSTVLIDGAEERFPVALRGEVYVTGLEQHAQLLAFWRNQSCAFEVDLTGVTGPIPRVGPIVCSGVAR